jgi:hypothetical protein
LECEVLPSKLTGSRAFGEAGENVNAPVGSSAPKFAAQPVIALFHSSWS